MRKLVIILIASFLIFSASAAMAQTFIDNTIYWSGWGNATSGDNTNDTIGIPDFKGGSATVTNGRLTNLTFDRQVQSGYNSLWWVLSPGDLFIDLGANQTWDRVVDLTLTTSWTVSSPSDSDAGPGNYNIYSISLPLNIANGYTNGYIFSGKDGTNGWSGYNIRDDHPVAVTTDLLTSSIGSVSFSGWKANGDAYDYLTTQYTFNLAGLNGGGLDLGTSGQFTIGWAPNCANDVIYNTLTYTPIPEPASFALLGLGLLGLAGLRKRNS